MTSPLQIAMPFDAPETQDTDEHQTPVHVFQALDAVYHFTLDPCTTADNPLGTPKYYTRETNGLNQSWAGEVVFCNPPYSRSNINLWVAKCIQEALDGAAIVVALLPGDTSTALWQDDVWDFAKQIVYLRRRLRFVGIAAGAAKFGSHIAVFEPSCLHEPVHSRWNPSKERFPRWVCQHCPDRLLELRK